MTEGVGLTCQNCGYKWNYKGKSQYYASCPMCLRKVPINQPKEEGP